MSQNKLQARFNELFAYCPATGKLFNNANRGKGKMGGEAGSNHNKGYRWVFVDGRRYLTHRVIWMMLYGNWPREIDHINHLRADNRLKNLREVSQTENFRNQTKYTNNTSGVCGVVFNKRSGKWKAQMRVCGQSKGFGEYYHWFDAVCARKSAEHKYGYHINHGR